MFWTDRCFFSWQAWSLEVLFKGLMVRIKAIFSTIFFLFLAKKSLNVKPVPVFREKVWTWIRGRPELEATWRQRSERSGRVVTMPWSRLPRVGWMGRVEYTPTRPDTMLPLAYNSYMVTTRVADPDPNWIRIQSGQCNGSGSRSWRLLL